MTGTCQYCNEEHTDLNEHGVCQNCEEFYGYCENCDAYTLKDDMYGEDINLCHGCYCSEMDRHDPLLGIMEAAKISWGY